MGSYLGRYAELYDVIYGDKPYAEEAAFLHACVRNHEDGATRTLLDLACGTGSHSLELTSFGYAITAVDYSRDMLECARKKAEVRGAGIEFRLQDMRELDLPGAPFDAAICMFDSIGYVITDEAVEQVLRNIHRHVRPRGLFVFEFWHAAAMLRHYSPVRVRRWPIADGELLRISETTLDREEQVATVDYSIYELGRNGTYRELHETQRNRFFSLDDVERLLHAAGFGRLRWHAGFSETDRISDETWHILCVARRR